jgi:CubicO group peptidase (beta-lactamase class C family)
MPQPPLPPEPDEWMRRFGTLPLMHQPAEKWMCHTGSDVLGMLIARAAGQPFETFLQERLFEPLGVKDTAFSVSASKLDRFVTAYATSPKTGALQLFDVPKAATGADRRHSRRVAAGWSQRSTTTSLSGG